MQRRMMLTVLFAAAVGLVAGCASTAGTSLGPAEISLPGGGSLSFTGDEDIPDIGSAAGMGEWEDPAEAVAALKEKVAELESVEDSDTVNLQVRAVRMSQLANARYNRYQQAQDLDFLRQSVEMTKATIAEVERIDSAGLVDGISMPLITAQSIQEVFLKDREAELAKGGSF